MKPPGNIAPAPQVNRKNNIREPKVIERLPAIRFNTLWYLLFVASKRLLKPLKKRCNNPFLLLGSECLSMSAHNAGVSVRALIPEITMAKAKVRENCR